MKMSKKIAAVLVIGMIVPTNSSAPSNLSNLLKAGFLSTKYAATTIAPLMAVENLDEISGFNEIEGIFPTSLAADSNTAGKTNADLLEASISSAVIATALISKKNSFLEIIASGVAAYAGTAASINILQGKRLMRGITIPKPFALATYLLGQNAVQILTAEDKLELIKCLFKRHDRSEVHAFLVRNFLPLLIIFTQKGRNINANVNFISKTLTTLATIKAETQGATSDSALK